MFLSFLDKHFGLRSFTPQVRSMAGTTCPSLPTPTPTPTPAQSTNIVVFHDYWTLGRSAGDSGHGSTSGGRSSSVSSFSVAASGGGHRRQSGFGVDATGADTSSLPLAYDAPRRGDGIASGVTPRDGVPAAGSPSQRVERPLGPYGPEHRGAEPFLGWLPPPSGTFGSAAPVTGGGSVASIASGIPTTNAAPRRRAAPDR
jgi:hypothetical protein